MPNISLTPAELPSVATANKLRLPTNSVQMFVADPLNLTPAVQSRHQTGVVRFNINAGASVNILAASVDYYFVINSIMIRSSLNDIVIVSCGGTVLLTYDTVASENLYLNFHPNGLFSGHVNTDVILTNAAAVAGLFSWFTWGLYIHV